MKKNVVFDFFLHSSFNIIMFYIIVRLISPQKQNFFNYRNILSGSREIRKRKNRKILKIRFYLKNGRFKKFLK